MTTRQFEQASSDARARTRPRFVGAAANQKDLWVLLARQRPRVLVLDLHRRGRDPQQGRRLSHARGDGFSLTRLLG
jgi:hypothetical protein